MKSERSTATSKQPETAASGAKLGCAVFLALVLGGSLVVLFVVLSGAHDAGRKALDGYVASIRKGATVSPVVAGEESSAVTELLRRTSSLSVSNFQSQHGTSCFWVALSASGRQVDARFVLSERGSSSEVVEVSLRRECECPIDFEQPCHLR